MKDLRPELQIIAKYLKFQLLEELEDREHIASGKLKKSMEVLVLKIVNGFNIQGKYLDYGAKIEQGTRPGRLVPLSSLVEWIRYKKMRGTFRGGTAFSIQQSIKRNGIRPDPWQTRTLQRAEPLISQKIEVAAEKQLYLLVENMIQNTIKLLDNGNTNN